jgi:hemerythrin
MAFSPQASYTILLEGSDMEKLKVAAGIFWVEIPEADLRVLCGCPADSVKHLMKRGLIREKVKGGVSFETGPNAILLSDTPSQKGSFANLAEFPVLQMLYRQGMLLPNHPNNTGRRPMLIGLQDIVRSQSQYIFRGNYGLVSEEELTAAGVPPAEAHEMFRIKRWFAFGKIRNTEELIDLKIVDKEAIEIAPSVFIHRKGLNRYKFICGGESVEVDMNLGPNEEYEAPYDLGSRSIRREYFSIIHIGEGDGWDTAKPCMASIVCFQGRLYLIDAGPNIMHSLTALGIGMNEIEGIFQTHCHDDHFAGLTSLVRSDRRLRYYAVPWVRVSVEKKLEALMGIDSERFARLFEVHDLTVGEWNPLDGLEVRPVTSPHPVETTVLYFRVFWEGDYKVYAHFADLPSSEVLSRMLNDDTARDGITRSVRDAFLRDILQPVEVKKIDAGGGLIHGKAEDFAEDGSSKIILSHNALPLTEDQKEIGSSTSFGLSDVLIPVQHRAYLLRSTYRYLTSYFPGVPTHEIDAFSNGELVTFNAGSIMLKKGVPVDEIYLILSGVAEVIARKEGFHSRLSAGALAGELAGFLGEPSQRTFRAASHVTALRIPCGMYRRFVTRNGFDEIVRKVHENRQFLFNTPLFGDMASFNTQNAIARAMEKRTAAKGTLIPFDGSPDLFLLAKGEIVLSSGELFLETLAPGEYWGEASFIGNIPQIYEVRATEDSFYFTIPGGLLLEIPSIQWKLLETFDRRMKAFRTKFNFEWQDFYTVGEERIDEQHRTLFTMINELAGDLPDRAERLDKLLEYARYHFTAEEAILDARGYARLNDQRSEHRKLLHELERLMKSADAAIHRGQSPNTFFKDWLINHTLLEDRRFKDFLSKPKPSSG